MIKYAIHSVLTLTVLVAGIFAFMPIEEVSTVHTTIQATSMKIVEVSSTVANFDLDADDELAITSDKPFSIIGINCVEVDAGNAEDMIAWTSRIQGTATGELFTEELATTSDPAVVAGGQITHQIFNDADVGKYAANGGQFIVFDLGTVTSAGSGDETIDCKVQVLTSGDSTTVTAVWRAA